MDFDWNDYVRLAQLLAQQEDEAAKRTAISRAYYSMFHLARERAIQNGCKLSYAESSHKSVWDFYMRSPDADCKSLGLEGSRLKERRNVADYDLPFRGRLSDDVQDAIQRASAFSQRLATLDPRQPRASA